MVDEKLYKSIIKLATRLLANVLSFYFFCVETEINFRYNVAFVSRSINVIEITRFYRLAPKEILKAVLNSNDDEIEERSSGQKTPMVISWSN